MSKRASGLIHRSSSVLVVALLVTAGCSGTATTPGAQLAAQGVAVAVAPTIATVALDGQQAFVASVTGTANTSVTWQIPDAGCGTVTTAGLYTAPAAPATCHVVVTSTADATQSASAVITVSAVPPPPPITDTAWAPLKVGAGGFLTGIDFDPTGATYVVRTDTYGAYIGNGSDTWQQVVTSSSMPASLIQSFTNGTNWLAEGVYEIRVAPSMPTRLYMIFKGSVWRSDNRGVTWSAASTGYVPGSIDPNDGTRSYGEKMAVDPANPDVVYAGSTGGLYLTTNGGASWALVAGVAAPSNAANLTGITFDPTSGTSSGRTNTIYAVSNGNGVYRSSNAGASWALLPSGPATATHAAIATDGAYYVANGTALIYRYLTGSWATSASLGSNTMYTIATDPLNPARIVAGRDSGHIAVSTDRGASWILGGIISWTLTRQATDVPWLAFANESYMSNAAMRFDPVVQDKLWFAEGIGVWYSTNPAATAATTWISHSVGIEQLVAFDVVAPPGRSNVVMAGSDRSVWVVPRANTSYPSQYVTMGSTAGLIAGHAVNYSIANPSHLVAIINRGLAGEPELSGYSLDDGATWTKFPAQPGTGGQCGDVVAPSIDNIIAVIGTKYAYRSTDRGTTWTNLTLPGDSGANTQNLHAGYNTCRKHILAVDGANPSTVYLYFYGHGLYRSTNGGASWTLVNSGTFDAGNMFWQVHLRSVPGQAGHLFMTAGQASGSTNPQNTSMWRSTDGGVTWAAFQQNLIAEPFDIALGAPAPGHTYPAVYFAGWYRTSAALAWTWGLWRSIDFDVNPTSPTWAQIGPFPYGSLDEINNLAASQDTFGEVYVAFNGSGWVTGRLK